jgi:hypothetical protein
VEVSGRPHSLATLPLEKNHYYLLNERLWEPYIQSGSFGGKRNLLPLLESEPQIIQFIA